MELPRDEWTQVISFLDYRDLGRLSQCSRAFHELTEDYIDPTMDNNTPIIVSCSRGLTLAAKKLLADHRVDPHADEDLALRGAVMNDRIDCLDLLLKLDFPIDSLSLILIAAVRKNSLCISPTRDSTRIIERLLLDPRCDPTFHGYRSAYYASMGSDELFSLLIPYGYDEENLDYNLSLSKVKMLPEPPTSLLVDAVEYGNLDLIEYLAPLAPPDRVAVALRRACHSSFYQWENGGDFSYNAVKFLIPYYREQDDIAPYLACIDGSIKIVRLLLDHGIEPSFACLRGVVDRGYLDIVQLLLPLIKPRDLILRACGSGNSKVVNLLIPYTDMTRYAPEALVKACSSGCLKLVDRIMEFTYPTLECLNQAARGGYSRVVRRLLTRVQGDFSQALELAASKGRTKVVKILLGVARVTDKALELSYPHHKVVRLLLPYAYPSQETLLACCAGYPKSLRLLLKDGRVDLSDERIIPRARDNSECIEILLKDGRADPSTQDNRALVETTSPRTIRLLLSDPRVDPTTDNNWAIRNFRNQWVAGELLRDPRIDPSANGCEALSNASSQCILTVKLLLEDPRVDPLVNNCRALRTAALWDRVDIFAELVRRLPLSMSSLLDIGGFEFCLRYAIHQGDLSFVKWLARKGEIDLDALDYACRKGDYDIVEYLLRSTPPGPNTLYYCLSNHQLVRLLYTEERAEGYRLDIMDSCLDNDDIPLLKTLLSSPSKWEIYREDLSVGILSEAMLRRDKELLRLALPRTDPSESGEYLLSLGNEEMNRILLRHPTMEPFR